MTDHPDTTAQTPHRLRFTVHYTNERWGHFHTREILADSIETAYRDAQRLCTERGWTLRYVVRTP